MISNDKDEREETVDEGLQTSKSTLLPFVAKLDEDIICSGVNFSEDNECGEAKAAKTENN